MIALARVRRRPRLVGIGALWLAGYALARLNFPGRALVFTLMVAAIMIPTEMTIIPLYLAFLKLKLVNSYFAIILPSLSSVFSVYLFRQFFLTLPRDLEDAAAIAGAILLFSNNWNAFLWPLLVMLKEEWKTLPIGVATFGSFGGAAQTQIQGFGIAMAAVTILALPSLLVFLALQRHFVEGVAKTGLKG